MRTGFVTTFNNWHKQSCDPLHCKQLMNIFVLFFCFTRPSIMDWRLLLLVSLTLLSQTWSSSRSSLRVSTGSSWSAEAAVRLSPSTPERVALSPLPHLHPSFSSLPVSPVLPPSHQCCFIIMLLFTVYFCKIVLSHPTNKPAQLQHLSLSSIPSRLMSSITCSATKSYILVY